MSLEKPQSIKWHKGQIKQVHLNVSFRWLVLAPPHCLDSERPQMYYLVTSTVPPGAFTSPQSEPSPVPRPHTLPTASGQFQKTASLMRLHESWYILMLSGNKYTKGSFERVPINRTTFNTDWGIQGRA